MYEYLYGSIFTAFSLFITYLYVQNIPILFIPFVILIPQFVFVPFFSSVSEQPIFTCHAHVFHIDPKTKRTWITASTKAVSVSFFYDSSRNLYRIISVEGSKAVINSTITPNMSFTQTSQKFGQWSDVRANTVYGLGFSSEAELTKFVEKFQEVKEATKSALTKTSANGKYVFLCFIILAYCKGVPQNVPVAVHTST